MQDAKVALRPRLSIRLYPKPPSLKLRNPSPKPTPKPNTKSAKQDDQAIVAVPVELELKADYVELLGNG